MKKLIILLLALFGLLGSSSLYPLLYPSGRYPPVGAAAVRALIPETEIYFADASKEKISTISSGVGDTLIVNIMVYTYKDMYGHEIAIAFNTSLLEYVGSETPNWKLFSGRIGMLFWVAGQHSQIGDVLLMSFAFKSKAVGTCALKLYHHELATLHRILYNTDVGWPILHEVEECTVTIS